jgi:hypothetical protein
VDYFSTLGYQPGIALMAAGILSPVATLLLVIVTLFGAVPVYQQVAKRSFTGQGSIAMLENLLKGWRGKLFVLFLLGFAATDFVITITLSAADAALHIIENPMAQAYVGHANVAVTLVLVIALAVVFLIGFKEAIGLAALVAIPYLILTGVVLVRCVFEVYSRPSLVGDWWQAIFDFYPSYTEFIMVSAIIFPKLALGMSGFETGVSVMPLVQQNEPLKDNKPLLRIEGTKKLLLVAALIMSLFLLLSSFATTLLISPELVQKGGEANGRAIAYLAHTYLGSEFGTLYDIFTIAILWFAGASAMAGLLNLIPRYLPRFGMAPAWVEAQRPLVLVIMSICILVTLIFKADVDAQGGAYATGVLVLILSAAVAVTLSFLKERKKSLAKFPEKPTISFTIKAIYFGLVSVVFLFTLVDNVIGRPDGLIISGFFIVSVVFFSILSRWLRAGELRVESHTFVDEESAQVFQSMCGKKVNLLPISDPSLNWRKRRLAMLRSYYNTRGKIAFLTIKMRDDRSEFQAPLRIFAHYDESNDCYLVDIQGAVAIPNTIAYISEQLDPIALYLGLARKNAISQALSHLFFGEGEVGIITYKVLVQYWETTQEEDVRPIIFLVSE